MNVTPIRRTGVRFAPYAPVCLVQYCTLSGRDSARTINTDYCGTDWRLSFLTASFPTLPSYYSTTTFVAGNCSSRGMRLFHFLPVLGLLLRARASSFDSREPAPHRLDVRDTSDVCAVVTGTYLYGGFSSSLRSIGVLSFTVRFMSSVAVFLRDRQWTCAFVSRP